MPTKKPTTSTTNNRPLLRCSAKKLRKIRSQVELDACSTGADIVRDLLTDLSTVRKSLRWALEYIADGTPGRQTPSHDCDFETDPLRGMCAFHEDYWDAMAILKG